jgi:hypothetical protein
MGTGTFCIPGKGLCMTRVSGGTYIRALAPTGDITQTWKVMPALNNAADSVSLCDPWNENSCLIFNVANPGPSSTFTFNMSTSFDTSTRQNAASFLINRGALAAPNDDNNIPIYNHRFTIRYNTTDVISCEYPAILSGAADGDCLLRPITALSTGVFGYKWATWLFHPAMHTNHSDIIFVPSTIVPTENYPATAVIPTTPSKQIVSLQPFHYPNRYATKGSDNVLYGQLPLFGIQAHRAGFRMMAGLNGWAGYYSFQDRDDPTKYLHSTITSVAFGTATVPLSVSVPSNVHDASFELVQGIANRTILAGYGSFRQNGSYYMWLNLTSDRSNPVKMRNVSNIANLNVFEKEQMSWRPVRDIADTSKLHLRDVTGSLKNRYDATGFLGLDESNTNNPVFTTTYSTAYGELHVTDPIGDLDTSLYGCDPKYAHSLYFHHSTSGVQYWIYASNKTTAGDTYASYNAYTATNPGPRTPLTNAAFPGSFVFCVLPAFDTTDAGWGITITLWNDTATAMYATGSQVVFDHPVGATDMQKVTMYPHATNNAVLSSPKSFVSLCLPCEAGYSAATRGRENCTACAIGKYSTSGSATCLACPAGSYNDQTGQAACLPCAAGQYSGAGATVCIDCGAGTFSSAGASACSACNAGTFSAADAATVCDNCPAGSYSDEGASNCTDCAAGHYTDVPATATCKPCPQNSYQPTTGHTECVFCAQGECYTDTTGNIAALSCDKNHLPTTVLGLGNCNQAVADNLNPCDEAMTWGFLGWAVFATVVFLAMGCVLYYARNGYSKVGG